MTVEFRHRLTGQAIRFFPPDSGIGTILKVAYQNTSGISTHSNKQCLNCSVLCNFDNTLTSMSAITASTSTNEPTFSRPMFCFLVWIFTIINFASHSVWLFIACNFKCDWNCLVLHLVLGRSWFWLFCFAYDNSFFFFNGGSGEQDRSIAWLSLNSPGWCSLLSCLWSRLVLHKIFLERFPLGMPRILLSNQKKQKWVIRNNFSIHYTMILIQ